MDIKNTALHAAKTAGLLLREKIGAKRRIEHKGAIDLVTEMDKRSEALIIREIKKKYPDHGIMAEESASLTATAKHGCRWIIDPLDGTTNYAHGLPVFCVSIGFEKAGKIIFGVVYNPMLDEMFVAEKGRGARLNGKKIKVSAIGSLDSSLLATGFPYDIRTTKKNNLDHFKAFAVRAQAIRRAGAAALDLCYVACSRFDGFWELKLKPWDTAAASMIVKEAGGRVTGFAGGRFSIYGDECLASNGLIHHDMMNVLKNG
ncbi:MAG: inositol monophosphatase [Deltaproteobacteria bacterium]|nr:inositol monophosphatase [Deltaproteobacteria bacterium]